MEQTAVVATEVAAVETHKSVEPSQTAEDESSQMDYADDVGSVGPVGLVELALHAAAYVPSCVVEYP